MNKTVKIVNKTDYDTDVYREFNEMALKQRKKNMGLTEYYQKQMRLGSVIYFSFAFLCLRIYELDFFVALISNNIGRCGEFMIVWGVVALLSFLMAGNLLFISYLYEFKFYKKKTCVCNFDEAGIVEHTTIKNKTKTKRYSYHKIKKIVLGDNLILVYNSSISAFLLKKDGFTEGDPDMLLEFLKTKIPKLKIIEV